MRVVSDTFKEHLEDFDPTLEASWHRGLGKWVISKRMKFHRRIQRPRTIDGITVLSEVRERLVPVLSISGECNINDCYDQVQHQLEKLKIGTRLDNTSKEWLKRYDQEQAAAETADDDNYEKIRKDFIAGELDGVRELIHDVGRAAI